jgi:glyoxylase-like metal-dependent hydrolase (beta-lactamase superfamily II)
LKLIVEEKSNKFIQIELSLGLMFQTVNCYLIPGDELTLIDCGVNSEENWKTLNEKFEENGFKIEDLDQLIITHEHPDHIGLLPQIIEHTNAIVKAPRAIKKWFFQPKESIQERKEFLFKMFHAIGFPEKILKQTQQYFNLLGDGKKIEEENRFEFTWALSNSICVFAKRRKTIGKWRYVITSCSHADCI